MTKTGRAKKRRAGNTSGLFFVCGGNSARRSGAWPAASITRAMKAGCKQPAQMAFEGCAAVRTKLRAGAYTFASPSNRSFAKVLAGAQQVLTACCGRALRGL